MRILHGDCLDVLPTLDAASFHAVVTDPPYELSFMGRAWDSTGVAFRPGTWAEVLRVLKPGGHMVCFGGTRTAHRMACAIEDAGFEIRDRLRFECSFWTKYGPLLDSLNPDQASAMLTMLHDLSGLGELAWEYGTGFPKSHDVSRAIDKEAGAVRQVIGPKSYGEGATYGVQPAGGSSGGIMGDTCARPASMETAPATPEAAQWQGWGSALKPAHEPIVLARKPLDNCTIAANVLKHGVGGINIDACRVEADWETDPNKRGWQGGGNSAAIFAGDNRITGEKIKPNALGRFPANIIHDGSDEVMAAFAAFGEKTSRHAVVGTGRDGNHTKGIYGAKASKITSCFGDTGTAARFFFSGKANKADRADSKHPTVKPLALMEWLVKLITPPGGVVLDPFAGSGITAEACMKLGFDCTLIDIEVANVRDIQHRIKRWSGQDTPLFAETV